MSTEKLIISSAKIKSLYNEMAENKLESIAYQDESMESAVLISAQNITAACCHSLTTGAFNVEFLKKETKEEETQFCPCVIGSTCWPSCRDW